MATIPDDLARRILDALGESDLGQELRRAMTPSNGEVVTHVAIPERFLPHFAGAVSVGANTSMMCGHSPDATALLRQAAKDARSALPEFFGLLRHRSDGAKLMDMLVTPGIRIDVLPSPYGWRRYDVTVTRPDGREYRPCLIQDLDSEQAEALSQSMQGYAERIGDPAPREVVDAGPGW